MEKKKKFGFLFLLAFITATLLVLFTNTPPPYLSERNMERSHMKNSQPAKKIVSDDFSKNEESNRAKMTIDENNDFGSEKKKSWPDQVEDMLTANPEFKVLVQPLVDKSGNFYEQTDPELIQLVKERYLLPPSQLSYQLSHNKETSMGQAQVIRTLLSNKTGGFFVECGGFDGETRSNSLTFEKELGWQGVLVEADLANLVAIKSVHRHSWVVPACLSTATHTQFVTFRNWGHIGKIVDEDPTNDARHISRGVNVTCIPLYSILKALDQDTVDYFSLDVEGNELHVLKTIPFDKLSIQTLSVEFVHEEDVGESKSSLEDFMTNKDYVVHSLVTHPQGFANDFIFMLKELSAGLSDEVKKASELMADKVYRDNYQIRKAKKH